MNLEIFYDLVSYLMAFLAFFGHFWAPLSPRDTITSVYGAWSLNLPFGRGTSPKNTLNLKFFSLLFIFFHVWSIFHLAGPIFDLSWCQNFIEYGHIKLVP